MKKLLVLCAVAAVSLQGWAAIQTAGSLLVDVSAVSASGVGVGGYVSSWANAGVLIDPFVAWGHGPVYQPVGGVPAVYFDASAEAVMIGPATPQALVGNGPWTIEAWVRKEANRGGEEVYLAWTLRDNVQPPNGRMLEARYYNNWDIAVEHYGNNLSWGTVIPPYGEWHHVAITREASGIERLFVDGRMTLMTHREIDIAPDGDITLGGTWQGNRANLWGGFLGYIGAVRIHSGTLSATGVVLNYLEERAAYGRASDPECIWQGAAGVTQQWENASGWLGNFKPDTSGASVTFENGNAASLTSDAGVLMMFNPYNGGLVMDGNAALELELNRTVYFGSGVGNTFMLDVRQGYFDLPGSTEGWCYMGVNGGSAAVTLGGGLGRAEAFANRDFQIGNSGYGTMGIGGGAGGGLYSANGWVYIGLNPGGTGLVSVADGGEIAFRNTAALNVMVGHNGGHGELRVGNGGAVRPTGDLTLTPGGGFADAFAGVWLEAGGLIEARSIQGNNSLGERYLYLDGGTIKNRQDQGSFLTGLTAAYLGAGGVTFDIIEGSWAGVAQTLQHDPSLGGGADGGLVKRGGGLLILNGMNDFTGDITVEEGYVWFNLDALTNWTGMVQMNSPGVGVGLEVGGHMDKLLAKIPSTAVGQIMVFPENANDTFDFRGYPGLSLGIAHRNVTFGGTFIPHSGSHPYVFAVENNAALAFNEAIQGGASVVFNGTGSGTLRLGGANAYTGGTTINGGTLIMTHADALGSSGGITIRNGAALRLEAGGISPALITRITPDSVGFVILGAAYASFPVDLTGKPGITVGTDQNTLNYASTITPEGNTYRAGGGGVPFSWNSNQGLVLSNLQDNGPAARKVVIQGQGLVRLAGGNTYSGGTSITNKGALFLREDGGLGAVPPSDDPSNVFINGGAVRSGEVWFETAPTRGWEIGPLGAELHPWGGNRIAIRGNLSGSGDITLTDGGTVALGGPANTWTGKADLRNGSTLQFGLDGVLSRPVNNVIVGNDGWLAVDIDATLGSLAWTDIFGTVLGTGGANVGLRKRGAGTLVLDVGQAYSRDTVVEAGTLMLGSQDAIPCAPGKGSTGIEGVLDLNGYEEASLGAIYGAGAITDSVGSVLSVNVGCNNASATFSGSVIPGVTLVKLGTGNQVLNTFGVNDVAVQEGTLTTLNPTAPAGAITLGAGATLAASGVAGIGHGERGGLLAYYYNLPLMPVVTDFDSLGKIKAFISGTPPSLATNSASAGATLDFDYTQDGNGNRCRFAAPYDVGSRDQFALCLMGSFLAETPGEYTFGTQSDDGSFVIVDNEIVLDNNYMQGWLGSLRTDTVTLEAGEHDFMVFFYEGNGGQGLSVYMAPPGVTFDMNDPPALPQSLLSATAMPSRWPGLDAQGGSISLVSNGAAEINTDINATASGGTFTGTPGTLLVKTGSGTQTLAPSTLNMQGAIVTLAGELAFGGAGTLASLDIGAGSTLSTSAKQPGMSGPIGTTGLIGKYYSVGPVNGGGQGGFPQFNELATYEAYLAQYTPVLMASSLLAGETFYFGHNGSIFPPPFNSAENFQVLWKGRICLPADDEYIIGTASDDGSMLFIDGVAYFNNNYSQGVTERSCTNVFTAGWHDIAISFYQGGGGYGMMASIEGGGLAKQYIPNSILAPAPLDLSNGAWLGAGLTAAGTLTGQGTLALDGQDTAMNLYISGDCTFGGGAAGAASTVLFKTGPSTLTLTGDNSAFHGKWCVLEGALIAADGAVLGAADSETSVLEGASLAFDGDVSVPGKITGNGTLRFTGNGTVTIGDLTDFTGTIEATSPGQSLALLGGGAPLDATRIAGVANVMLLDGMVMYVFDPSDLPASLVTSNATLVLAVTDLNKNDWDLGRLTVMAGTTQQVTVCETGLYGKYYNIWMQTQNPPEGFEFKDEIKAALESPELAEAYLAQQQFVMALPSWYYGDGLVCQDAMHPPPYNDPNRANFIVTWKGKVRITEPGRYTFGTRSDDNSMLFINGKVIVYSNKDQGPTTCTGTIDLTPGLYDIDILFCQQGGGHWMDAYIQRPGDPGLIPLPNAMLVTALPDTAAYGTTPAYTFTADTVAVEQEGLGTVDMQVRGILAFNKLWIDTGAVLEVTGAAKVAGATLTVAIPEELPTKGAPVLVGDFTQTSAGLERAGVKFLPVEGSRDAKIIYRNHKLYLSRVQGTVMILR